MTVTALVLWIITAVGGFTMAGIWLAHDGPAQHAEGKSRLSPARVGLHFGIAACGLLLWIAYLAANNAAIGWLAFVLLPAAAVVGFLMFMTWLAGRGAAHTSELRAEQNIPVLVVAAHGIFAVLTVVAVLVALTA